MPVHLFHASDWINSKIDFEKLTPPARLAVLGYPIAHSRSPEIQNAFLKKANLPYQYVRIEVPPENLSEALQKLRNSNFVGVNLTIPHKQKACALVDEISNHAQLLGGINTILVRNQKLYGYNTDGPGFIAAIQEQWKFSVKNKSILILGATGGAGRAVATQCALEGTRKLYLASRRKEDLAELIHFLSQLKQLAQLSSISSQAEAISYDHTLLEEVMPQVDLIVNATPLGMKKNDPLLIPSALFHSGQFFYDMVYEPEQTPLMQAALKGGATVAHGTSMLEHQAALAFQILNGGPEPCPFS